MVLIAYLIALFLEWNRPRFPPVLRVETTNLCNAHCTICPRETIDRKLEQMDQELFEKIIKEATENDCKTLQMHNFGEPLLDRLLPERIKMAKEAGIDYIKIFSNGSQLKEVLAERLIESGLDEIKISIDGSNFKEFERIRIGLDLEEILDNSKNFIKKRELRGRSVPKIA